jgi:hypothetical protein
MTDLERRMAWPGAQDAILQASWVEMTDWPDALTPDQIGALHARKDDGSSIREVRDELARFLQNEIDQGRIDAVTVTQASSGDMGIVSFWDTERPPVTFQTQAIAVSDCARLLAGVDVGKYLKAWLAPYRQQAGERIKQKQVRKDSPDAALERVLKEIETRAGESGQAFDVERMPGQTDQLFELCRILEPAFKTMKLESFKRYTKRGRCKWELSARSNPSAVSFYRGLFPKLNWDTAKHKDNPGAVSRRSTTS